MSTKSFLKPILVFEYVAKHFNLDLTRPFPNHIRNKVKRATKCVRIKTFHHVTLNDTTYLVYQLN